jgi:tRNA A-37 threonylcarbamoyl transferase component Bud32
VPAISSAVCAPAEPVRVQSPSDELLGQVVGNFRIVRLLGRGGMGAVYLGEHTVIGSKVAMKFLHPQVASDPVLVQRFFAEARAVNLIGHENIVAIIDLSVLPPARYYLVMEYLEGTPLSARIGRPFPIRSLLSITSQVCDAIQAAHDAGVVHRDLKPDNIFLVRRDGDDFVKIVDFGIARLGTAPSGVTAAGFVVGTPEFMAPEQWVSSSVDGRADQYAIGVIAYAMATGRLPFHESGHLAYYRAHTEKAPPPPRQLNPELSAGIEQVILKALSKQPDDRFSNVRALKLALEATASEPRPVTPVPAAWASPAAPASPASAATSYTVDAHWGGNWCRGLTCADLSAAGMLVVCAPPYPPLLSPVVVRIAHPDGTLETEAEVVRHVTPEQAEAWKTQAGFAVQFSAKNALIKAALERLQRGEAPFSAEQADASHDDPEAEAVLERYRSRLSLDHYAVLGTVCDAPCSEVRQRSRHAVAEVESLTERPISFRQRMDITRISNRLREASEALADPARRATFDATHGNFRGVARCLSAGLSASEAERLRREFLTTRPRNETMASLKLAAAHALATANEIPRALAEYEAALRLDPLNLDAHHAYWSLKKRIGRA